MQWHHVAQGIFTVGLLCVSGMAAAADLFELPAGVETRWVSFENPSGEKGAGGQRNAGAKGAAFEQVKAGEEKVLLDIQGSGTVRRRWFTLRDRSPEALRSYVLRCYWDGAEKPAVEVPFGDFMGAILGKALPFESELFANPEGRSFNCYIPMPFRKSARITFTNESEKDLSQLFYDVDLTINEKHSKQALYFHATWRRENPTTLGKDFEFLPKVTGKGRFLGAHVGVLGNQNLTGWWGEGEVKMYVDGDTEFPTICGTGTEDYIGTAYGQGEYAGRYQGSLIVDNKGKRYAFYRHHVPDPVYFHKDIRVTLQQMGGDMHKNVRKMVDKGEEIDPIALINDDGSTFLLNEEGEAFDFNDPKHDEAWTNLYRRDDMSAVALFYLDKRSNGLPPIAPLKKRTQGIKE